MWTIIKEFADAHPDYKRIRGSGWFITNWGDEPLPDKRLLDEAIPDRPVYLICADCHSMWLNSRALEEAGIDPDRKMDNGVNVKFENGELSGLLLEPAACEPAQKKYMEFSEEEMREIHRNFQDVLADYGIAAASEMFADDYTEETMKKYDILKNLDEEEGLKAQIFSYMKLFGYTEFSKYFKFQKHFDSPHFHIAGVKGFIDGVTETYTGLLLEPYTDKPETCGEGLPLWPERKMKKEIIAANKAGIQVRLHCIADGSVRMALDLFEKSAEVNGEHGLRNTIEHIENIHSDDLDRFAELDVIPSVQPYHVTLAANGKVNQIGEKRARLQWPFRTLLEHEGALALGSDYPVVTIDPFTTIYAAVTRRDDDGNLTSTNSWEKISMADTLKAYTSGAARVYHVEDSMGTLEPGKMADIIVLGGDPEAADCYVGADAATTGSKLMEEVMKDIDGKGNVALLLGPMGSDGQVGRSEGFDQVLADYPDVTVAFQDTAEWQTEPALTIVENWLNAGKEISAVVAQNDSMAVGAAKAIADAQKTGEIKVYGIDATSEGLQAVLDGKLQGTMAQGTADQGKFAADACADLLDGKEVDSETIVDNVYYTADNAQEALDAIAK